MRRREFISLLGGAAATWPGFARAQQPAMPVVGFISIQPQATSQHLLAAFHKGLGEAGYVEGKNVAVEYRSADGNYDKLPGLIAELVARKVAVIAAAGGSTAARALKAGAADIPFVFTAGSDPVKLGIVTSLRRPGGNATGVTSMTTELEAKRLELLREVAPHPRVIAFLVNPDNPDFEAQLQDVQAAARAVGQKIVVVNATSESEIDGALKIAVAQKAGSVLVANDALFNSRRVQLAKFMAQHRLPAIYAFREYVAAGGLMSYATSLIETLRQVGLYTGRILKGEKAGNLPVVRPTKFELVVNLKTAKELGLKLPPSIMVRADEVIE
jgi:putative ABC transport system substrate-binding protein